MDQRGCLESGLLMWHLTSADDFWSHLMDPTTTKMEG